MHSRPSTTARRLGAIVGPAIVGAFLLASCGGAATGATQSTINLDATSTAFVVRPPATTTLPPTGASPEIDDEGRVRGTQEYTVQPNDYPYLLVERFGISLDDLVGVNEWGSTDEFPSPGVVILIPPGAVPVSSTTDVAADTETPSTVAAPDTAADAGPAETIPDAGDNCAPGSYTIASGDYPIVVAEKFDVTVEALNDANASTSGYSSFFVGLEIVIPAKSDC